MQDFVVYTAVTPGYDTIRPPPSLWRPDADFVAFMDRAESAPGWASRPIYRKFRDPCRNAKIHKILPHRYFPGAKYSLWLDGSITVKSFLPLCEWPERFLPEHDLAVFQHPLRQCAYLEAAACMSLGLDSSRVIDRQMKKYFAEGYPQDAGLAECSILFRRHTENMRRFNEEWYAQICAYSRRDQLSFNYVARKLGVKFHSLPGYVIHNDHFDRHPHQRRHNPRTISTANIRS